MTLDRDLARLRTLDGIKWNRYDDDVIPAWVADMDLPTAPVIVDTLHALIDRKDFGYNLSARSRLGDVFADWQRTHHGWELDPELVRPFCDVLHAIETVLWHNTEPGDGIVLMTPIYPPFIAAIEGGGRSIIDCPLHDDGWRFDPDVLRSVCDENTRVVLMCNPHNPTGRAFDDEELRGLAEVANELDLIVISDEVWGDLTHPGAVHRPFEPYAPDHTVTVSAASKAFNMAGLRCAVAHVGSEKVRDSLAALSPHLLGAVSSPGAEATIAAWEFGADWLEETKVHLTAQRDHLHERLAAELPVVGWQVPEATYLAWLDFRPMELGPNPTKQLLDEARIALSPGPDFGFRGEGFARLNTATTRPVLDAILDRLVGALT